MHHGTFIVLLSILLLLSCCYRTATATQLYGIGFQIVSPNYIKTEAVSINTETENVNVTVADLAYWNNYAKVLVDSISTLDQNTHRLYYYTATDAENIFSVNMLQGLPGPTVDFYKQPLYLHYDSVNERLLSLVYVNDTYQYLAGFNLNEGFTTFYEILLPAYNKYSLELYAVLYDDQTQYIFTTYGYIEDGEIAFLGLEWVNSSAATSLEKIYISLDNTTTFIIYTLGLYEGAIFAFCLTPSRFLFILEVDLFSGKSFQNPVYQVKQNIYAVDFDPTAGAFWFSDGGSICGVDASTGKFLQPCFNTPLSLFEIAVVQGTS